MILEWEAKMRKRFYEWASEYIDSLDISFPEESLKEKILKFPFLDTPWTKSYFTAPSGNVLPSFETA